MEWVVYAVYGLLMAIFGFLLWLMLKDARMTHSPEEGSGWGRGFDTFMNHKRSQKDKDN